MKPQQLLEYPTHIQLWKETTIDSRGTFRRKEKPNRWSAESSVKQSNIYTVTVRHYRVRDDEFKGPTLSRSLVMKPRTLESYSNYEGKWSTKSFEKSTVMQRD